MSETKFLLERETTTATSAPVKMPRGIGHCQATGDTSTGSGSATIEIEGSNRGVVWESIYTLTLTLGTTETSTSVTISSPWGLVRARVTAISGTDAAVSVDLGV